jgi:hypothetical protein
MSAVSTVELLWCEGCPSVERALDELRAALVDVGLDATCVQVRQITTDAEAHAEGFVGSPTIRIDGVDAIAAPQHEAAALTCRVYHRRDGRFSPTPDPAELRSALRHLVAGEQVNAGD